MGTNSEFCSDERVGYTLLKSFLAGDVNANRCYAGLSPEEQQRQLDAWQTVQRGHAVANGLPVITVNRCGYEPDPSGATGGISFWGNSFVAGPQGEWLYRAGTEPESPLVDIDMARSEQVRRWWPFLRDRRIDAYGPILNRFND